MRLIHFTLKEYFSTHPAIFNRPHLAMAEICLTYLNSQQIKAVDPSSPWDYHSFLGYCSLYWGVHAKQDLSDYLRSLALQLLQEDDYHVSIRFLEQHTGGLNLFLHSSFHTLGGVHCASFFGIVEFVAALIEMQGYSPNRPCFLGDSPLAWSARSSHEEVVKMLLGWEAVNSDEPNDFGQTQLSYAAPY